MRACSDLGEVRTQQQQRKQPEAEDSSHLNNNWKVEEKHRTFFRVLDLKWLESFLLLHSSSALKLGAEYWVPKLEETLTRLSFSCKSGSMRRGQQFVLLFFYVYTF